MTAKSDVSTAHPEGEKKNASQEQSGAGFDEPLVVDTEGGRYQVQWDDDAPFTPMGQLVFFAQFLKASQLFKRLCADAPFQMKSNNAPEAVDVLGTFLLSILAGHLRYAHITALRFDTIVPPLLGMSKVVSEDSARRSLKSLEQIAARKWLQGHLRACWEPLLYEPWVLDMDTTIKTVYGKQEGAEVGYNPHKPGRPSHTYHTYWIARIRLCLDVEVRPGKEHAGKHGMPGLWEWIDSLPRAAWPQLLRGDCGYGNEANMKEAEARGLCYLFRLRQTKNTKQLIRMLDGQSGWQEAGQGWEAMEGQLRLMGWSCKRRVIVLRKRIKTAEEQPDAAESARPALPMLTFQGQDCTVTSESYEYQVLVTSAPYGIEATANLYRERADSENPFDELKNQWGWGGFTTHDFERCQIIARLIALFYNWWSLFVRLVDGEKHREAITSRPMMMGGVARQSQHAGQRKLSIRLTHGRAKKTQRLLADASAFLKEMITAAEQLSQPERWRRILSRIYEKFLEGRLLGSPHFALPSG